jgi:uncharacterized protein YjdB
MLNRFCFGAILLLTVLLVGCTNSQVGSIAITPGTQTLTTGQTAQFAATGTIGHATNLPTTKDVSNLVTWTSSAPAIATVSSSGLATAVSAGTTTLTASMPSAISGTATVTVTGASGGSGGNAVSLAVIPGAQSVGSPNETSQFIAIGTTAAGATLNLTTQVVWSSSSAQIATINSTTGLATGVGQGTATMTALYTSPGSQTVVSGTATMTVANGTSEQVTALTVYPDAQAATAQAQESQFFVLGTVGNTILQYDETSQVVWTSSNPAVATIGTTGSGTPGLATAVGAGVTTITATWTNLDGSKVVATANYSVSIGSAQEPLLSINIVPGGTTVSNKGQTGQYLAFGTYSTTPTVRVLTYEDVKWISMLPEVASIEIGGLATAQGYTGNTVIYAEATNPDGTVVLSNPETFTCKDSVTNACNQEVAHPQFATITVFIAGENTTPGYIVAPSGNGVPNLIHCGPGYNGPGGQVCTGTYETGTTVILKENFPFGSTSFGGWSSGDGAPGVGCQPDPNTTLLTSTQCTVTLNGNTSVGTIFY